jgi:hypothetical protein
MTVTEVGLFIDKKVILSEKKFRQVAVVAWNVNVKQNFFRKYSTNLNSNL